jgi:hypothetical protein
MRITKIDPLLYNEQERKYYIDPKAKPNVPRQPKKNSVTKLHSIETECSPGNIQTQKEHIPQYNTKWKKYMKSLAESSIKHATKIEEIEK